MDTTQIDRFFHLVSRDLTQPVRVILTGAAAGALWGSVRPSMDIDFALIPGRRTEAFWNRLAQAIEEAARQIGIRVDYAEDIDRWSSISLLDYQRHTRLYRRFGRLEVRLLEPAYWSIGKMTRYLDPDVRDMVLVFKRQRLGPERLARVWGKALRKSPRSGALSQFRRQVEDFLRIHGRGIWGKKFHAARTLRRFYRSAGIKIVPGFPPER